jgi:hypothetical protein
MTKKKKAFEYLKKVGKATSLQIGLAIGKPNKVGSIAIGSMMADLRKLGCDVRGRFSHISKSGAKVWEYELLSWPKGEG